MKTSITFLFVFVISLIIISCDDGDIIVTTFDFDQETPLSLCQQDGNNVLYFIDSETNEAISLEFDLDEFDGSFEGLADPDPIVLNIDNTNRVIYRKLSGQPEGGASAYYCQQVPPSSPQVLEEFISTTGGTVTIQISILAQDDDDDVPAEIEDRNNNGDFFDDDSDGDGIPDFLDIDDDNDNVLTKSEELEREDDNGNIIPGEYTDTDNDGNRNYLDNNDDGDAVLTINEDLNYCDDPQNPALNPTNDINVDGLPHYLNNQETGSVNITILQSNVITRSFLTTIVFTDITFESVNSNESLTFQNFPMGRYEATVEQRIQFLDGSVSDDDTTIDCP